MTIMAVDNHCQRLGQLAFYLQSAYPNDAIVEFTDPFRAVQYINKNKVDIAFVDFELRPFDALKFAEISVGFCKGVKVYVVTDNAEYREYIAEEFEEYIYGAVERSASQKGLRPIAV